jgi:hypothetical protein
MHIDRINFTDSGAAGDVEFPDPAGYPGDEPGGDDGFSILAHGNLVIPRDGTYHFGIHSEDHCALCIGGRKFNRIVHDTGHRAKLEGDTIYEGEIDRRGANARIVGEITLEKGTYPIEVLQAEILGTAVLSVFGGPAGFPPRLLTKGGAAIEPDIDGLPLAP